MLVLSRKLHETIRVGDAISVTVLQIKGNKVRLGIKGPADVPVLREEIWQTIDTLPEPATASTM